MLPDVAKLVEAVRIPKPVGERLSQLAPGNFCIHKSFGAGKVIDWDLPAKKVTIDFEKSSGQTMELQFAFQKTEWIAADDFRAKKIEQLEELLGHHLELGGNPRQPIVEKVVENDGFEGDENTGRRGIEGLGNRTGHFGEASFSARMNIAEGQ